MEALTKTQQTISETCEGMKERALRLISEEWEAIESMLLSKNRAYGNSATQPLRVFSKADPTSQILVRIDDKLSRVAKGHEVPGEETIGDLIGYLVLLRVQDKLLGGAPKKAPNKAPEGVPEGAFFWGASTCKTVVWYMAKDRLWYIRHPGSEPKKLTKKGKAKLSQTFGFFNVKNALLMKEEAPLV